MYKIRLLKYSAEWRARIDGKIARHLPPDWDRDTDPQELAEFDNWEEAKRALDGRVCAIRFFRGHGGVPFWQGDIYAIEGYDDDDAVLCVDRDIAKLDFAPLPWEADDEEED